MHTPPHKRLWRVRARLLIRSICLHTINRENEWRDISHSQAGMREPCGIIIIHYCRAAHFSGMREIHFYFLIPSMDRVQSGDYTGSFAWSSASIYANIWNWKEAKASNVRKPALPPTPLYNMPRTHPPTIPPPSYVSSPSTHLVTQTPDPVQGSRILWEKQGWQHGPV